MSAGRTRLSLLLALALTACGGSQAPESAQSTEGVAAAAPPAASAPPAADAQAGLQADITPQAVGPVVYRFAKSNGAYFYTGNEAEKDDIARNFPNFRYEGVAFSSSTGDGSVPVYRFANLGNGGYFFTANEGERDFVRQTRPDMRYEGSSFSVASADDPAASPVYRLANLTNGAYLYTVSRPEYDLAVASGTWRGEGIAFYAYAGGSAPNAPLVYDNTTSVPVPDNSTTGISSTLQVTRTGPSGTVEVRVQVTHTYIGDLVVELVHPDGTVYSLHNRDGGTTDNINRSYTVNVGNRASQGTWTLRVRDVSRLDTGTLTGWRLSFATPGTDPGPGTDPNPVPMPPGGWTVSGTISMAPTAAVDSDTNDPNQTNRRNNDDFPVAQALRTPVLLVGSVNLPRTGPQGATYSNGDEFDVSRVSLKAGQVVEIEFSADPDINDLDLYIFNSDMGIVGESYGLNRYECVRIRTDGTYYVAVHAYDGASVYNLRIGSPGESAGCPNSTARSASIVTRQLVAAPIDTTAATAERQRETQQSIRVQGPAVTRPGVPQLLSLPASARERAQGLRALTGRAQVAPSVPTPARSEALQDVVDTVGYAKRLQKSGLYRYVEPNRYMFRQALTGNFPPNDRQYVSQRWHYNLISLPEAMARVTALSPAPTRRPLVAVIDTGIVADHPDLLTQIADGYSFISVTREGDRNTANPDDPSRQEDRPSFHGTHVAGTIGAVTYNAVDGAGVAPMAQLMPLRVFRPESDGATAYDIVQAVLYAAGLPNSSGRIAPRKADVINMSLGGNASCPSFYRDAIAQARAQGVIVVAASGNESRNDLGSPTAVGTPANCAGVISVGALDARARQTYYSNSGPQLTVAAPGGDAAQSTNGSGYPDSIYSTIGAFDFSGRRVASFGPLDGTSMATPHVAGVMALMRYVHPAITPDQIDQLFAAGRLTDDVGSAGRDNATGHGLINAAKAVDAALALRDGGTAPPVTGTIVASPASLDFGSLQTSAEIELRATGGTSEAVTGVTSGSTAVTVTANQVDAKTRLGTYTVRVDRSRLTEGTHLTKLTVRTTLRTFEVAVSVFKPSSGTTGTQADFGPMYVLLIDPATDTVVADALATASNGRYRWQVTGLRTHTRVQVLAGADTDNDSYICARGEPCGAFPVMAAEPVVVDLSLRRTELDFSVVPFGGSNSSSQSLLAPLPAGPGAAGSGVARPRPR